MSDFDQIPLIIKFSSVTKIHTPIYENEENYDEYEEILKPGKYWMGSNKTNTRCNKFTIFGADKTHADDTKEKSA